MTDYVEIEDERGMARDLHSKGLVKTNKRELEAHRAKLRKEKDRDERINNLEHEVSEIKGMLKKLLDRTQ